MQGRRRRGDSSRGEPARLPPIAPRQESSPSSYSASSAGGNIPSGSGGNRLPPRSRSGCWTCRSRKVKCDEQRPACGVCLSFTTLAKRTLEASKVIAMPTFGLYLVSGPQNSVTYRANAGQFSDYNPRISFRDDTPRVVERMQEVSTVGSTVWDPNAPQGDNSQHRSVEDLLPPFSALTTDEERERKAELQNPGTYHVIANQSSFVSLPAYRDEKTSVPGSSQSFASLSPAADEHDASSNLPVSPIDDPDDPNVVILKVFEEPTRKGPSQLSNRSTTSPASPVLSPTSTATTSRLVPQPNTVHTDGQNAPVLDIAHNGGWDAQLLQHYRTVISPYILRAQRPEDRQDLFELQAQTYPPLFHAMMALSALSMAHQNGVRNADALEHYQQVIPALKITVQSSQDSYSDGAFLTHFILLLYEIAAAGHRENNMWQHHTDQLLRIVTLRRQAHRVETYDFLVWLVCRIDIYALLSASGTGSFVEVLLEENMLPTPERTLPPISRGQASVLYPEEQPFFPALSELNQEVLLVALQVGQLARDLRAEEKSRQYGNQAQIIPEPAFFMNRRTRIQNLHRMLEHSRASWKARFPEYWTWLGRLEALPHRVFAWVQQAYMLFRACIIYAHTSMFPNQLRDPAPDAGVQIRTCATEIIESVLTIVSDKRVDPRFVVFPLFLAGFATVDPAEKSLALSMMKTVERHSYGGCTGCVRSLLEKIYEKQRAATLDTGDATSVDWIEERELRGQPPIIYGI